MARKSCRGLRPEHVYIGSPWDLRDASASAEDFPPRYQKRGNKESETSDSESERLNSTSESGEPEPNGSQRREVGRREMGLEWRKMNDTSRSENISTRLLKITELARKAPNMVFTTLAHHIDLDFLREAYRRTRKDGAVGVDGQSGAEYAVNLEANLTRLLNEFKSGRYKAPPVRRVEIPKADGKTRPIGIPSFEDKVLQRAVAMVLEAVYEQDFLDCSYGFRPNRSAHQALDVLWKGLMSMQGGWVVEVDIKDFFGSLDYRHLRQFLNQRVHDGVIRKTIDKWLAAGVVLEKGQLLRPEAGSPQGGVISPLVSNIYLHEVMDKWFEETVRPLLRGRAFMIRYADDIVCAFADEADARRVFEVLPKRFAKYGLELHDIKTRLVRFHRPSKDKSSPEVFDFLGFTHKWGKSRLGNDVVKRETSKGRLKAAIRRVYDWCKENRHITLAEQHRQLELKLQGHYGYYGITGNFRQLQNFLHQTKMSWFKWLQRRSEKRTLTWGRFKDMTLAYPLPRIRIVHSAMK